MSYYLKERRLRLEMKIEISNENAILQSLNQIDQTIEVVYKEKQRAVDALEATSLVLERELYINEKENRIVLVPKKKYVTAKYEVLPDLSRKVPVIIADFEDSEKFYELAHGTNSPFVILEDRFSGRRRSVVLEHIERIETDFRGVYLKHAGREFDINTKGIDHPINELSLSDLVFKKLLSSADEEYYLENIKHATDDKEILSARSLTKLDQLGLPFSKTELESFIDKRNKVMHFRVLTTKDVFKILRVLEKLHKYNFSSLVKEIAAMRAKHN